MAELWRDIEEDIDDELDARKDTVDLDDGAATIDASVDLGPIRSMLQPPDLLIAGGALVGGLFVVHWVAPKIGSVVMFLIVVALFGVWAGMIAGVQFVGDLVAGMIEATRLSSIGIGRLFKRSRLALAVAVLVLVWGVLWHTTLSPSVRNASRVHRVLTAVSARVDSGAELPDDDLEAWLDVRGADPFHLSAVLSDGVLCDVWGEPMVYRKVASGRFHLYSTGPNRFDDRGSGDDQGHADLTPVLPD